MDNTTDGFRGGNTPLLFGNPTLAWGLQHYILSIASLSILYGVTLFVYRIYFSPLAKFPGPKLAAGTAWYEFYYDVITPGRSYIEIERMHDEYGPIVRINPWELSIRDPDYYTSLYVPGHVRKSDMFLRHRSNIGFDGSIITAEGHDMHRARRKPLDAFFSRQGVGKIEPMLNEVVDSLDQRFMGLRGSKTIVSMECAFTAFTTDIVSKICFEQPLGLIHDPEFAPHWYKMAKDITRTIPVAMQLKWLQGISRIIPQWLLEYISPSVSSFRGYFDYGTKFIEEEKLRVKNNEQSPNQKTIIRHILESDMPEEEKTTERLRAEVTGLLIAGSLTTTRTLVVMTYYVLNNPEIASKVRSEMKRLMAQNSGKLPTLSQLEQSDYNRACVKEALRVTMAAMRRIPRRAPDVELTYKQWTIPKNTPVGMSAHLMHTDKEVFPDPWKFDPERWMGDYNPLQDRNYVPFTKGSRSCLGAALVYAELHLALAVLFQPGGPDLTIYNTDESDVKTELDFILGAPKLDSKGLRLLVN